MIAGMKDNPEQPAAEQAFTTFRVPARPRVMVFAACALVLLALWEAATSEGSFTGAPGPWRTAVVVSVGYLAVRAVRAGVAQRGGSGGRGGLGPDIERIEP